MQKSVEQLIGDLLLQHNCVVVPAFGGFVAQRISAKVDFQNDVITPPRKSIMFNKQLVNNDGLLVAAFAHENKLTYDQAFESVKTRLKEWDSLLQIGGRVTIDRVGNLFFDQERNLCFEQDRFYNLLMESFGLSSVHFVSLSDVQAVEAKEAINHVVKAIELEDKQNQASENTFFVLSDSQAITPETKKAESKQAPVVSLQPKSRNQVWRYVAAACLLPVAFYSFWLPMKTDVLESGVLSLSDFNPFHQSKEGKYVPFNETYTYPKREVRQQLKKLPKNVETFSYELDEDTFIPVSVQKKEKPTTVAKEAEKKQEIVVETKPVKVETRPQTSGSQIIVGSFTSTAKANELISELATKGITGYIVESNGKVRVSVGSAQKLTEVKPALEALGITPWVLK